MLMGYILGLLIGIIHGWNRKVMFFIWIMMMVYLLIMFVMFPMESSSTLSRWTIPNCIVNYIGICNGSSIYKNIFRK